jgi:hypothetical protein
LPETVGEEERTEGGRGVRKISEASCCASQFLAPGALFDARSIREES